MDRETERKMTPLQAEMLEAGIVPQPDELGATMERVGVAPEIGYGDAGPHAIPSPDPTGDGDQYRGPIPVFQWEIDPDDPSWETREASVSLGDWEYEVWLQEHPAGLTYVAIQALKDDFAGDAERGHPLGRNVVVNLVYDRRREGVVAIYGTARDFRPFVEAYRMAAGVGGPPSQDGGGRP